MHNQGNVSRRSGFESSVLSPASLKVLCPIIRAACLFIDPGGPDLGVTAAVLYPSRSLHHVPGPSLACALARLGRGVPLHRREFAAARCPSKRCEPVAGRVGALFVARQAAGDVQGGALRNASLLRCTAARSLEGHARPGASQAPLPALSS